jgi:hypothetical protein
MECRSVIDSDKRRERGDVWCLSRRVFGELFLGGCDPDCVRTIMVTMSPLSPFPLDGANAAVPRLMALAQAKMD